jgi:subtilisin family serine protease
MINASANIAAAHRVTTGKGTTIAVIDDGIDIDHPEFAIPGKIVAPRDILSDTDDPRPRDLEPDYPDDHGTCCAGVACAAGVDGASGVAPGARLMPIRIPGDLESFQEGLAIWYAASNGADVISCSWGAIDGDVDDEDDPQHFRLRSLPAMTRLAIEYAVTKGRNGRGCVLCFPAGNGNESVDNDGYASYHRVIAVAASNHKNVRAFYSDYGNAIWCTFPGGESPVGIWTTDRLGQHGETNTKYTGGFGGTSAATPGAAGVAALILSVNPELRWDEVRDIMRRACDRIDKKGGNYDSNGHSPLYGYGRLNGGRAVALAQSTLGDRVRITRQRVLPTAGSLVIPFHVGEQARVQGLIVRVAALRPAGRQFLALQPPRQARARRIVLDEGRTAVGLGTQTFDLSEVPALAKLRGKPAKGLWQLEVRAEGDDDAAMPITCSLELTLRPRRARRRRR